MRVLRMGMFKKIVVKHDVGMGEAYMDGDYVVDNLGVGGLVLGVGCGMEANGGYRWVPEQGVRKVVGSLQRSVPQPRHITARTPPEPPRGAALARTRSRC
jgi:hypothetical protein